MAHSEVLVCFINAFCKNHRHGMNPHDELLTDDEADRSSDDESSADEGFGEALSL